MNNTQINAIPFVLPITVFPDWGWVMEYSEVDIDFVRECAKRFELSLPDGDISKTDGAEMLCSIGKDRYNDVLQMLVNRRNINRCTLYLRISPNTTIEDRIPMAINMMRQGDVLQRWMNDFDFRFSEDGNRFADEHQLIGLLQSSPYIRHADRRIPCKMPKYATA